MTARTSSGAQLPGCCARSRWPCWLSATLLRWFLRDDLPADELDWLSGTVAALGIAGIPVVGALIASRLPANPYGWLWCTVGLAYGVQRPGRTPRASPRLAHLGAWLLEGWGFVSLIGLFVFVFLLFPTGRLPTRGGAGSPGPTWRSPCC